MKESKRWIERLLVAPNTKQKQNRSFLRLIAPSILSIFLCTICLVGLTWAWFVDQDTCEVGAIQTSQFTVDVEISRNTDSSVLMGNSDGSYTLQSGSQYSVKLTASGTASTGYCAVTVGDQQYVTTQIMRDQSLTFTIDCTYAATDVILAVTPNWMTYSGYSEAATDLLGQNLTVITMGTAPAASEEAQPNETETKQLTELDQINTVETEKTEKTKETGETGETGETEEAGQPLETSTEVEASEASGSPEASEPSGSPEANSFTVPMPEGSEASLTESDAAATQEQEDVSQTEAPEAASSEP